MTDYETLEKLNDRLHQLSAMVVMTHEGSGFQDLEPQVRAEYMWAITEMVEQAKALSDETVSGKGFMESMRDDLKGSDKPQQEH